jgi:hypothetical protein
VRTHATSGPTIHLRIGRGDLTYYSHHAWPNNTTRTHQQMECVRPVSLAHTHTLSHLNPSVSKCRNRTRFISLAALLFGGEFRNLAPRSTAVCSLRLQTSKRQSLRWEKHHACNIAAALACCWGGSMFQRKRKVTPETVCACNFSIQTNADKK